MKRHLFLAGMIFQVAFGFGQVDLHNTGILHISGGSDIVHASAGFTNTNTASLVNNGHLYIRGILTNNQAGMSVGTGTLYLNGTSAQSVEGGAVFRTYNLVTNNTSGITLNNNLSITSLHTFSNGILTTSSTPNYLVYEAGSSYLGDADARHVNGWVKKIGNTDFSFPVGNGSVIRKAALQNLSGTLEFNCRWDAPTPNPINVDMPLILVDVNEYWMINRVDASGTANVWLNWDDSKVNFPDYVLSAIRVGYFTGGLWTDQGGSATGDITTTGNITSNPMNAFGAFTFASNDYYLPIQFISVEASRKPGHNLIEWKTFNEETVLKYEVERSNNGTSFLKIGTAVSNNSLQEQSYSFKDLLVSGAGAWYRIRSVDRNGKSKLSSTVYLNDEKRGQGMYLVNNPIAGAAIIYSGAGSKGNYDYLIATISGQVVQSGKLNIVHEGLQYIRLNNISTGVYVLSMSNGLRNFTERIIVK